MTPLRAQIVAARAYEKAWMELAASMDEMTDYRSHAVLLDRVYSHRRAAEIMEAEAAKEEVAMHKDSADVVGRLVASLSELLGPLENASAEMVRLGKVADQNAEAAFDRAREAIADGEALRDLLATPSPAPAVTEAVNLEEAPEIAAIRYLNDLRGEYGSSVTILCDDEEAMSRDKQMAIEVCSDWTQWAPRRFYGESILQCAAKAVHSRDALAAIRANGGEG